MRKIFSALSLILLITSLTGCMDDPNQGNPRPKGYGTPDQQGSGVK